MPKLPKSVRVCIIGAGVAGLGAAQRLWQNGIKNIVILEAQDRIGGRIHTIQEGNAHLELGAHWIHGEEGNVVFQWAAENNLVDDEPSLTQTGVGETVFLRHDGKRVPEEILDAFEIVYCRLSESFEDDCVTYGKSIGDYMKQKFKQVNEWGILGEELLEWKGRFQNCIDGTNSWYDSSANSHHYYKECPGNPVVNWKDKGYQNLLMHLKEQLPDSCISLSSPVKSIEWNLQTSVSAQGCKVILESNQCIEADYIIFTPSLAVLKAVGQAMFNPQLPLSKLNAIEGLGIDVVNKIYLKFPYCWWESCDGFSFLHNLEEASPIITEKNWEYGLLGFYEVYKQPDMLCGWITGQAALMMEKTPVEEVGRRCCHILQKILSSSVQVPNALWCKRSCWGSNPWIRGSYSFRSNKSEAMNVWAADLAEPLHNIHNKPLVCFAGEATHDCYFSTVHGALETGWREADRLLLTMKSSKMRSILSEVSADRKYDVIIVGAGAAGVGAARELKAKGIKSVLILEGSERVGGRINTIWSPKGAPVDLGAQWIHGEEGNLIHQFAKSQNLLHLHLSIDGGGTFYMENGVIIPDSIVEEVLDVFIEADQQCQNYENTPESLLTRNLSVGSVFRNVFVKYLNSCKEDSPVIVDMKKALYFWALRWQRIDNACSLEHLSAKCWNTFIFCSGNENMNPKSGFSSIINALLKDSCADVLLENEVISVDYVSRVEEHRGKLFRSDGVTYPVIIKCKNGRKFEAQHIIITSSIGYLKSHPDLFFPKLPTRLQKAIENTGFGTLNKIFLEYEERWWPKDCEGIQIVWSESLPQITQEDISEKDNHKEIHKNWVKFISGFDPVFSHDAVLCVWIGGQGAEYTEKLEDEDVSEGCTNLLRKFLGRGDIPSPCRIFRSRWSSNHFSRGSYSYHSLSCECDTRPGEESDLNMPVFAVTQNDEKVPLIVLAGEANSKHYYSTVHGALQNGIQQASHYLESRKKFSSDKETIKSKL